ncbi:MAG TPA: alkaline phosphatase family protein [Polyangiales bacterium]|nr:alkaline phosphatase family protein [Polyangiales bacterium]
MPKIDHVFVLQFENRSFDHLFGSREGVDGIEAARAKLTAAGSPILPNLLQPPHANVFVFDPPHDSESVARQIAGDMSGFVQVFEGAHEKENGFRPELVMGYLDRTTVPVSYALADQFAISDRWFSPIPTQTVPNRMYGMCGHSFGEKDNPGALRYLAGFEADDSVFKKLEGTGRDWRIYSDTPLPMAALLRGIRGDIFSGEKLNPLKELAGDIAKGDVPSFVWIEPTYVWTEFELIDPFFPEPNDDHPPTAMAAGQELLEHVYLSLRSNDELWKRSVLVVYYDEHGGFYDHVTPPACNPSDGFTTRGPRVPALVISPWVKPGSVVRPPEGQVFDHCSVLKFVCERFEIQPWTERLRDPSLASLTPFFQEAMQQLPAAKAPRTAAAQPAGAGRAAALLAAHPEVAEGMRNIHKEHVREFVREHRQKA